MARSLAGTLACARSWASARSRVRPCPVWGRGGAANPTLRSWLLDKGIADRNSDPRSLKHDRAGVVLLLHMEDRGLDLVKIEPLAQHVEQIELAAEDAPGRADGEGRGFGIDDRRVPALVDRLVVLGQFLVPLEMLEFEERAARRRGPLQDLRVVRAFADTGPRSGILGSNAGTSAGDGRTIELRIRISRRGGGSARCSGSRARV